MKNLFETLAKLLALWRMPDTEEQYLARAADASDFEVRLKALERGRV